jgi:hypothetical protein
VAVKSAVKKPVCFEAAVENGSSKRSVPTAIATRKLNGISCTGEILLVFNNPRSLYIP